MRPPARIDAAAVDSHAKAVETLRRQWAEEGVVKRYPFEWAMASFTLLSAIIYLLWEFRKLRRHVDLLLIIRAGELDKQNETLENDALAIENPLRFSNHFCTAKKSFRGAPRSGVAPGPGIPRLGRPPARRQMTFRKRPPVLGR